MIKNDCKLKLTSKPVLNKVLRLFPFHHCYSLLFFSLYSPPFVHLPFYRHLSAPKQHCKVDIVVLEYSKKSRRGIKVNYPLAKTCCVAGGSKSRVRSSDVNSFESRGKQ